MHTLRRIGRLEIIEKLHNIARKIICAAFQIAAKRVRRQLIGARRTTKAQINTTRKQRCQRAKLFGDHQR
ncbi:hypothetical protein D9M69_657540 [compost metagenome]